MDCLAHKKPIQFICRSFGCDLTLLCIQCRKNHILSSKNDRNAHAAQIISYRQAFEIAQRNINQNLRNLRNLLTPFANEQQIFRRIEQQKKQLLEQKRLIIQKINEVFTKQINQLDMMNRKSMTLNKNSVPFGKIQQKILLLQKAQSQIRTNSNKLRQMLVYSEQRFINQLKKSVTPLSTLYVQANQFYIYQTTRHDFFLSRLELKRKNLNNKLLQKVHNETNLYFLIDDYQQGQFLHYFSSGQNLLRIYNLFTQKWTQKKFLVQNEKSQYVNLPHYGTTVYEPYSGRFYLIGGESDRIKSKKIYWYSISQSQKWHQASLITQRSSCMATILYRSDAQKQKQNHYILIAGGVGKQGRNLKSCEIFDSTTMQCTQVANMNFAVSSGTLVTFNNTIAFRIGGLGQFQQGTASICQIAQKCDFTRIIDIISNISIVFKNSSGDKSTSMWTYLDLQVVNTQVYKKFNLYYAQQAAIQINPNEIFVFGGISHNNSGVNQSYIIQVESIKNKQNQESFRYYARWINAKPLISYQGFLGLKPIIYKRKVFSLQNISCGPNQIYEQEKKLIQFNMYQWKEIQNIVDI